MAVMKASEFVAKLKAVAQNYKTLYVMGCFGAPLTGGNVSRYCNNHEYNKQAARTQMIKAAANQNPPVFGFDCVCLIKGILWGWNGDASKTYGGASYAVNGVPDIGADTMITKCKGVSTNFSNVEVGEALWCSGHIGVYIGGGLAVECSPAFDNDVQITAVKNMGTKSGYNARTWTKHGKLPYIEYDNAAPVQPDEPDTGADAGGTIKAGSVVRVKQGAKTYTGGVLTLLIATEDADLEHALEIANSASREHPCRVIAVVPDTNPADQSGEGEPNAAEVAAEVSASRDNPAVDLTDGPNDPNDSNLNAQVRFGADAGAGEIIILRPRGGLINHPDTLVIPLLVPDAPVVAWWPTTPPSNPAKDLMGAMARSRITDALHSNNPEATIERLRRNWTPEDIDLSWTRLTVWRAMLASMLDQPPHLPITVVKVTGKADFLPLEMLCAWLRLKLGVPVETEFVPDAQAVTGVYLTREDGVISLERPYEDQALISLPGQTPQEVSVPMRTIEDCLTEELRRIDPDEIYAEVINEGWDLIRH